MLKIPKRRSVLKGPSETCIQQALVSWWALQWRVLGASDERNLKAIPMQGGAGKAGMIRTLKMRREGARKGTLDIFIGCPRGGYCGLWIELKKQGGRASDEQREMISLEREAGYAAEVCVGLLQACETITKYMRGKLTRRM